MEFESHTGATWPLSIDQVCTTLSRLERGGRVVQGGEDVEGHRCAMTDAGRDEVSSWFERPVDRTDPARDDLAIKLALAAVRRWSASARSSSPSAGTP